QPGNGGTVLAIAGEDFSIVASDTRLSEGFSIHTRDSPKCYKLTDKTVIGCSGFHGDCLTLMKIIEARLKMYKHSNNKAMTTGAIAAMLSTILYSRRFFLYYVYNIIGELDEEGKGAVYSFDPVGSYQRDSFKAWGSVSAMLQPLPHHYPGVSVSPMFGINFIVYFTGPEMQKATQRFECGSKLFSDCCLSAISVYKIGNLSITSTLSMYDLSRASDEEADSSGLAKPAEESVVTVNTTRATSGHFYSCVGGYTSARVPLE
ncbi:proteasome subunit beta type-1-like, partial [Microtus oregoni]|uniref:proteasome subunit beta type-1-like n=1 Tax=Microtus oregoni TaxID=111838 RepID=UPI001BB110CD